MLSAYGALANDGVKMPRRADHQGRRRERRGGLAARRGQGRRQRGGQPQAAYIITDIMAGNTVPRVNPYWGEWAIYSKSGRRRPAAYKTGTTSDNRDVHAYGYLATGRQEGAGARGRGLRWATATTSPTTAACRSTRRRRCGRPSSPTSAPSTRSRRSRRRAGCRPRPSTPSPASSPGRSRRRP